MIAGGVADAAGRPADDWVAGPPAGDLVAHPPAGDLVARPPAGDAGYALVAAVVAIAVLALMSLSLIDARQGVTAGVIADTEHTRLAAAADAGVAIAVAHLADPDRTLRWRIDGRPRNLRFADTDLVVAVEDERGMLPLNQLSEEQVRALFEELGVTGNELGIVSDSVLDWLDDDDEPRSDGAEYPYYARGGYRPRNGPMHSLAELRLVRGMTPALIERLRPVTTIYRNTRDGFDERFAAPLALAVMAGGGPGSPAVINRSRELAGQRVAIELAEEESLIGRPLVVRVAARRPGGSQLVRVTHIELTGRRTAPFVVRGVER